MVKMLTTTHYNGMQYKQGEIYPVDENTKKRWVKNGLAEIVKESKVEQMNTTAPDSPEVKPVTRRKKATGQNN